MGLPSILIIGTERLLSNPCEKTLDICRPSLSWRDPRPNEVGASEPCADGLVFKPSSSNETRWSLKTLTCKWNQNMQICSTANSSACMALKEVNPPKWIKQALFHKRSIRKTLASYIRAKECQMTHITPLWRMQPLKHNLATKINSPRFWIIQEIHLVTRAWRMTKVCKISLTLR